MQGQSAFLARFASFAGVLLDRAEVYMKFTAVEQRTADGVNIVKPLLDRAEVYMKCPAVEQRTADGVNIVKPAGVKEAYLGMNGLGRYDRDLSRNRQCSPKC